MKVGGTELRTIWLDPADERTIVVIDQRALPFRFELVRITTAAEMTAAISNMTVRGAGLIGASAAYGIYLAARAADDLDPDGARRCLEAAGEQLTASRPTAVNLRWAVDRQLAALEGCRPGELASRALSGAIAIAEEDVAACHAIGRHGVGLLRDIHRRTGQTVNVLTHCNAGWLAFVDHGTATAPIYAAHDEGIPVHVWVDETRPVNQGARLTAWELGQHGVAHTVVVDNAGGHLMQRGLVDIVITGTDRTAVNGDVVNKIGTYLKALAAADNGIPFYVALPSSTFDGDAPHGLHDAPIEERDQREVTHVLGTTGTDTVEVRVTPAATQAVNYGFDVTPARLVTGLITERGICAAHPEAISQLFPELISADPATARR